MTLLLRVLPLLVLIVQGCASVQKADPLPSDLSADKSGRTVDSWNNLSDSEIQGRVLRLLPPGVDQPRSWAEDLQSVYQALGIPSAASTYCATIAVVQQESSFNAQPVVPGLSKIVRAELNERASRFLIPQTLLNKALARTSPTGHTYNQRIDALRTEKQLNDLFQDLLSELPFGRSWLEDFIPVRTGGPMQVSVAFAQDHADENDYPYPVLGSIRDEVFSQRGGLYFGSAILLDYPVAYTKPVYRFADFNAGRYASRNVAFQAALNLLTKQKLALDGDLLIYKGKRPSLTASQVEMSVRELAVELGLTEKEIRDDLLLEKSAEFSDSKLYNRLFRLAEVKTGRVLPREQLPVIQLKSPKITRKLSTAWFANRVETRYNDCMARR
ncbi:DUF1615 domain-containing protein [Limnobacter parvus]|uniref:DUF1615 domain-containing protein n=1 Tax=Limnobacter parvus TaxID=2939690 RepID=A0ABT1XGX9_9BURK|nr:DUF1615 domain-containing protein [Limnobacter parvus]